MFFFSQIQMTIPLKLTYSDKLNKLEKQYERLLVSDLLRSTVIILHLCYYKLLMCFCTVTL